MMTKSCHVATAFKKAEDLTEVTNLRKAPTRQWLGGENRSKNGDKKLWMACGAPKALRRDGWEPTHMSVELPDLQKRARLWVSRNAVLGNEGMSSPSASTRMLGYSVEDMADEAHSIATAHIYLLGAVEGEVIDLQRIYAGRLKLVRSHRCPVYVSYDAMGQTAILGEMPTLPALSFATGGENLMHAQLPAVTLSGMGRTASSLSAADNAKVSAAAIDAYKRLSDMATGSGVLVQPVLARYRIEDPSGETLMVSAPVLLSPSTGFQACDSIEMTSNDSLATASGGTVSARTCHVELHSPNTLPEPWRSLAARAVVEISEPIHPVNFSGQALTHVATNGQSTTITLYLPGQTGTDAPSAAQRMLLVEDALKDHTFKRVAEVALPFSPAVDTTTLTCRYAANSATEADDNSEDYLMPNRMGVSFSTVCHTAGITFRANRKVEAFNGWSPANFINGDNSDGSDEWSAVIVTEIAVGSGTHTRAVATASGRASAPVKLASMLCYPDENAVSMTVTIRQPGGAVVKQTFALHALKGSGIACWVAPYSPVPQEIITAANGGMDTPESTISHTMQPGLVTATDAHGKHLFTRRLMEGHVAAVIEAPRTSQSWDFSRTKLIVAGSDGMLLVTLNGLNAIHATTMLDDRAVSSAEAICIATGEKGRCILAIAGGDLVSANQSGVTTLLRNSRAKQCGHSNRHGEVWLLGADGQGTGLRLRRLCTDGTIADADFSDRLGDDARLLSLRGHLMVAGDTLLDLGDEQSQTTALLPIKLTEYFHTENACATRCHQLTANFECSSARGSAELRLSGHNGSGVWQPLLKVNLSGYVNAPISIPLWQPAMRYMRATLEAVLPAGAHIEGFSLT